ncbi:uncharacterized protein LOC100212139 isoform X4 [Hydra vulgaris]|uniref:Uncharacterized protein LOC100212139 isoform X4 n=1 Tax=Hydra vulgaris TaxID=6087 RepID=A0ABM4BIL1_HYDVU
MAGFLGKPFLWLLCRHHFAEINITLAFNAISKETSKAPANKLLKDFQQKWITEFYPKVSASGAVEKFKRFPEQDLIVGSDLCKLYLKAKKFVTKALEDEIFPRNDYKHLVEYLVYYMNVKSEKLNNFHIYQPGACHNARFMAYAIYFLMLDMTSTVIEYLTPEKKHMVARVAFIVTIYYVPAFLKSGKAEHAFLNDFNAFKIAETIKTEWDYEVGNSLHKSMSNHTWYLSPKIVVLLLGDPHMKADAKHLFIKKLLKFPVPKISEISVEAPSAVIVTSDSRLEDLIMKESWLFFTLTGHTESV